MKTDDGYLPGQLAVEIVDPRPHRDRADLAAILRAAAESAARSVEAFPFERPSTAELVRRCMAKRLRDSVTGREDGRAGS
jgi:hypothetical protein